ncbi:hypothetical protein INR49_010441 [Caranx melampygus]|nr:hypothetical protein INR49_010441 [Caranx melampygus]
MARITLSCLPASWYCSVSLLSLGCAPRQRWLLLLLLLLVTSTLLFLGPTRGSCGAPSDGPAPDSTSEGHERNHTF